MNPSQMEAQATVPTAGLGLPVWALSGQNRLSKLHSLRQAIWRGLAFSQAERAPDPESLGPSCPLELCALGPSLSPVPEGWGSRCQGGGAGLCPCTGGTRQHGAGAGGAGCHTALHVGSPWGRRSWALPACS